MASTHAATQLMAFSLGSTAVVVASEPHIAREILTSLHFGNRPMKQSAKQLMFSRVIGFAPSGAYWRMLRRIVASHIFSPNNILAHEPWRQLECAAMVNAIATKQALQGFVLLRKHLQAASLNNIMDIVFGKRYHWISYLLNSNLHQIFLFDQGGSDERLKNILNNYNPCALINGEIMNN
ncbi:Cytochrome [Abeliophyllum distichum]|uniref:Cytochrome n=1 Tax=Abeliophyllum distichum TaxID=126358 RepID=A0ABD1TF25_9LAMI